MHGPFARFATHAALVLAAFGTLGCEKHAVVHEAETEGIYLDVGELDYQVQISRQLNPAVVPDDAYVEGAPDFVAPPGEDETWFGVFVRVQNQTEEPHRAAAELKVVDTQGNEFRPIPLDPEANAFAYQPSLVQPGETLPRADAAGALSSAQGALLLFKLTYESLGNRPLELEIEGDDGSVSTVELDI